MDRTAVIAVFAPELEHDQGAVSQDQRGAHRVVRSPDLLARTVEGVADVGRIVQQLCSDIGIRHRLAKPSRPMGAGPFQLIRCDGADQGRVCALAVQMRQRALVLEQ